MQNLFFLKKKSYEWKFLIVDLKNINIDMSETAELSIYARKVTLN